MSIGDQVAESYLFHRKKDLSQRILEDFDSPDSPSFFPIRQYLRALYRIAAKNPDAFILKVMSKIPIVKYWDLRLKKEAIQRSIDLLAKLG